MTERVCITFTVAPATGAVTRDGVSVDLGPDTPVHARDGEARRLQTIVDLYAGAGEFIDVGEELGPDLQQAVGEVLYRALGAEALETGSPRWL